jgi:hypothetical protein
LRALKDVTQQTGARLRSALERRIERVKQWLQSPWSGSRVMTAVTGVAAVAAAGWSAQWLWRRWRRRSVAPAAGRPDPVRREAGRWLRRLRTARSQAGVLKDLERLRYGARPTWPDPEAVFRQARAVWREAKRSVSSR